MDDIDPHFDGLTKGLPHTAGRIALSSIGGRGWRLLEHDLPLPVAVLRDAALTGNSRWMRAFLEASGARLAPHGKTTMSPELFARQLADGAWGLTVATAQQMRVARQAGVDRIFIANELVGPQDIDYVLDAMAVYASVEVYVLADSLDVVRRLAAQAELRSAPGRLNVLVEMGYPGGRAGCRDLGTALEVASAIRAAGPRLALAGVEAFEGLNQTLPPAEGLAKVKGVLSAVAEAARAMDAQGLFGGDQVMLSAGGSAYYDLVVAELGAVRLSRPVLLLLRSGCYLTHDAGIYERSFGDVLSRSDAARELPGGFENALEVWAYVLSIPEPGRAILGAGRRDFGHDAGPPRPLKQFRPGRDERPSPAGAWEIAAINDQHAHMIFPAAQDLAVGDMIAL
ncbi:MAG TPA: alanine racemase, partial [Caulobacteraceae bacterium]|nr:alanine racemase [Caulobacteraceae bacterium]